MFDDVPDSTLEAERERLERELEQHRQRFGRFRDQAHVDLDASVAAARARVDELLRSGVYALVHSVGTPVQITGLADAAMLAGIEPRAVAARWHALVDAEPAGDGPGFVFGSMTRVEYDQRKARLEDAIAKRANALARRRVDRAHAAAIAALEDAVPRETVSRLEPGDPGYGAQAEQDRQVQEVVPHG